MWHIWSMADIAGQARKKSSLSKISCTAILLYYDTNAINFEEVLKSRSSAQFWSVLEGLWYFLTLHQSEQRWGFFSFFYLLPQAKSSMWVPWLTAAIEGHLQWWSLNFPWLCLIQVCSWRKSISSLSQPEEVSPLASDRAGDSGWMLGSGQAF